MAVDCPDPTYRKCVAFGSGRVHVSIVLDIEDASRSTTEKVLELLEGSTDFIATSRGYDGTSLVHLAPMESVRYKTSLDEVFMHMEAQAITEHDPEVAGQRIALMWETGEDDGWMITNEGLVIEIYPTDGVEIMGMYGDHCVRCCSHLGTRCHHWTDFHEQFVFATKIQATAWL